MAVYSGKKIAQDKLLDIAAYCVQACLKAPQITGRVELEFEIITGKDLEPIIEAEIILGRNILFYLGSALCWQKAYNAGEPPVLLLIGAKGMRKSELAWDCGACGFKTCGEFNKYARGIDPPITSFGNGPYCMWKTIDYGTACTWACAQAWLHNVTNRVEIASGRAAESIGYLEGCDIVHGLPLGPMQDLYWYSRELVADLMPYDTWKEKTRGEFPVFWNTFPGTGRPYVKHGQDWWNNPKDRALVDRNVEESNQVKKEIIKDLKELREKTQVNKIKRANE